MAYYYNVRIKEKGKVLKGKYNPQAKFKKPLTTFPLGRLFNKLSTARFLFLLLLLKHGADQWQRQYSGLDGTQVCSSMAILMVQAILLRKNKE